MIYYPDYIGCKVRVIDKEGGIIEGMLISYEHVYDEEPEADHDSLGIQPTNAKGYYIEIPILDIIEFKALD